MLYYIIYICNGICLLEYVCCGSFFSEFNPFETWRLCACFLLLFSRLSLGVSFFRPVSSTFYPSETYIWSVGVCVRAFLHPNVNFIIIFINIIDYKWLIWKITTDDLGTVEHISASVIWKSSLAGNWAWKSDKSLQNFDPSLFSKLQRSWKFCRSQRKKWMCVFEGARENSNQHITTRKIIQSNIVKKWGDMSERGWERERGGCKAEK